MTAVTVTPTVEPTSPRHDRPPHPSGLATSLVLGRRALLKMRHTPEDLGDALLIPVIFTLLFTYQFGGALSGSTGDYLQFLLPGTLVMSVLMVTVYAGLTVNADRAKGTLDRFRSLPIWQPSVIVGGLIGDLGRYTIASSMVVGLGLLMGYRAEGGVTGVLLAVALIFVFAFSLSWVWTALGLVMRSAQSMAMASFLVQFPLTFTSNIFVDPDTMPGWLETFVELNPVSHLVTTERALMAGTATAGDVGWVLLAAAALVAVFGPLTMHLYRRQK